MDRLCSVRQVGWNHRKATLLIPKVVDNLLNRISWSTVSNAADKSSRVIITCLSAHGNDLASNNPKLTDAVEDVLVVTRFKTRSQLIQSNITQQPIKQSSDKSMKVETNVLVNNNDVTNTRNVVNDLDRIALQLVPVDKLVIDRSNDHVLINRVDKTINSIDRPLLPALWTV